MEEFWVKYNICLSSSFFERKEDEHRTTWLSNDGRTKKIRHHVIASRKIQQHTTDCKVHPLLNFTSDHKVLVSDLKTPKTITNKRESCS